MTRRRRRLSLSSLWLLILLVAPAIRADTPAAPPAAAPPSLSRLTALADHGHFDQVILALKARPQVLEDDSQARSLLQELELLKTHEAAATAQRHAEFSKAMAKMARDAQAHKIDDAMLALLDAHSLADDPASLMSEPAVKDLMARTAQRAAQAEKTGDWLEALSLYRELDMLFDYDSPYRTPMRLCERRVRLLRMYDPTELMRLYRLRAQRLASAAGKKGATTQPLEPVLGSETWQQQLTGVDLTTFEQAMSLAAHRHVSGGGYKPVLLGAINALQAVAETTALSQTFAGLRDHAKVALFDQALAKLQQQVTNMAEPSAVDAASVEDQIVSSNNATVDLPQAVLAYEMTDGALSNLDDFSNMFWPREMEELRRTTQGRFGGVGILLSQKRAGGQVRLMVVSPLRDSPALKAGIRPGDLIAAVDGVSTDGWSLDQAVRTITGPEGSTVTLGIERTGVSHILNFSLKRAIINIDSIKGWELKPDGSWSYIIDPVNRIGYVRLTQFIPQTADDLDHAVHEMQRTGGLNGLILDLRYDPGGLLPSAIQVANRFLRHGVIVSTVDADHKVREEWRARPDKCYGDFPLIVLVNEGSASASEIVSGALQAHGRALIVGVRSFGKGSVQDLFPMPPGSFDPKCYLKLTTQYYCLPNGRIIHRMPDSKTWGIEPDVVVKMTPQQEENCALFRQDVDILRDPPTPAATTQPVPTAQAILTKGIDPQLETALAILKTRLVSQQIALAQRAVPAGAP